MSTRTIIEIIGIAAISGIIINFFYVSGREAHSMSVKLDSDNKIMSKTIEENARLSKLIEEYQAREYTVIEHKGSYYRAYKVGEPLYDSK